MMRKILLGATLAASALLAACGGGSSDSSVFKPPATGSTPPVVASVTVTADRATLLSDGTQSATLTAYVRDASNALLADVPVSFSASSGGVSPAQANSNASGVATSALVIAGDSSLRTITVTARAGNASGTATVQVVNVPGPPTVGSLTLTTSTPTLPSDGSATATITATARDAQNNFLAGVPVVFSSNSGGLQAPSPNTTNASGSVAATLGTASDPRNRTITVTATAGTLTQTVNVVVTGTRVSIEGPSGLVLGATGSYSVALVNSADRGIVGQAFTVTSARGNTVTPAALSTDASGRATFTMNVTQPGNDTLTVSGFGLTATQGVAINSDSFTFVAPAANAEVPLGTAQPVTVRWLSANAPLAGQAISFTATRGVLSASSAVTGANGEATVTLSSTSAGGSVVTASGGTVSTQLPVEFVALTPSSIDVQSNVFTLAPNEQATLTAVVRDAAGNLVKNRNVTFALQDVTGGTLSLAAAVTNSLGRAQTVYTASSSTSARDGVVVTASVAGSGGATLSDTVALTVASRAVSISLGTGNTIEEPNSSQYKLAFTVQITDANGNGVPNVPVASSVLTVEYGKGRHIWDKDASTWVGYAAGSSFCADEDTVIPATARNGRLDPGEDVNANARLDVGNVALVTPASATTNAQGVATVEVLYPQDVAYWLEVVLEVRAAVQGTEFRRSSTFVLPGASNDFSDEAVMPPGLVSPFGVNGCSDPN